MKAQISQYLNIPEAQITEIREWAYVYFVRLAGRRPTFVGKKKVEIEVKPQSHKVQICTGSEYHTTERRGAMAKVGGVPIYEKFKAVEQRWSLAGNKGAHGKWCIAEYLLPHGTEIEFTATANGKEKIVEKIVIGRTPIDVEGYQYASEPCGWVVSI
jgi:hypothetical protein